MINNGDTAWLLISAALVLLMTPGLAFFYCGLVSTRNVVNTINMSFICLAIVPLLWVIFGFTLVFSPGNGFIGGLKWLVLDGLEAKVTADLPQYSYVAFYTMFAVIAPALISGSVVGRMKFKAYVIFVILWSLLVYLPIAHWVWGPDGWIAKLGAIDFAGGTVVHVNGGYAALTAAIILGPRIEKGTLKPERPHNVPLVILGVSLLWFGWYGFNAGSALAANTLASLAFLTTTVSTSASIFTWTILCWLRGHPSSAIGKACSAVIGLVAITPAAGYVTIWGAMIIGCIASVVCYFAMAYRDRLLKKIDDTLDVFICHGLSGTIGALMTGLLATKSVNSGGADGLFYGHPALFVKQLISVCATILTTVIVTSLIFFILKFIMPIRPRPGELIEGFDQAEHGESAYQSLT